MENIEYRNLTELLLNVVRRRPGMYLGKNHLSQLPKFILGYMFADNISGRGRDFYFNEGDGFLDWYTNKGSKPLLSFWTDYFLNEEKGDQVKAFELYFQQLEAYSEWRTGR